MSENCIEVRNVSKSFSGRKVVDDLNLEVKRGETFGLLGHNGAGKSTTIEMILGIKKPDRGSTESTYLRGLECSYSLLPIRTDSGWMKSVRNMLPFISIRQIICNF